MQNVTICYQNPPSIHRLCVIFIHVTKILIIGKRVEYFDFYP